MKHLELDEFQKKFGGRLEKAIEAKGLTNGKLAKLTAISKSHIGSIIRGEENTCLDSIRRFAAGCEVEPKYFFEGWD